MGHRFVGHGNRNWLTETEEYDLSVGVEGRLSEGLGYDARIDAYRAESFLTGTTLVHAGRIQSAIQNGHYDLEDPFSQDPDHLQAIKDSSLREEEDSGGQSLSARLALEGSGFASRLAAAMRHGPRGSSWGEAKVIASCAFAPMTAWPIK